MVQWINNGGLFSIEYGQRGLRNAVLQIKLLTETGDSLLLKSSEGSLTEGPAVKSCDRLGAFQESEIVCTWHGAGIEAIIHIRRYPTDTFAVLWSDIKNLGCSTIQIEEITLLEVKNGSLLLGSGITDWVLFKNTVDKSGLITSHHFGNPEFQIKEATASGLEDGAIALAKETDYTTIVSNYMTVIRSASTKESILLGYITVQSQFGSMRFTCSHDENEFISLQSLCSFDSIPLKTGEKMSSEKLIIDFDEAFQAIDRYAKISGFLNQRTSLKNYFPPSGWCSWYFFYESVTEKNILDNLDYIVKNHIPAEYILIDMGWEERLGDLYPNHKFPKGMKWLADRIHSHGKKAGIWASPFWVEPRCEVHREHPEWLLRDKSGNLIIFECHIEGYVIDTTVPEARQWITEQFRRLREDWGYDYFKVDFLRAVAMDKSAVYANPVTRAEALRLGMEAIREGIGEDAFLLACGGHYGPTLGIVDGNRTSNDIGANWETLKITFKKNILRYWMNENWWVNDPDCLLIRGPQDGAAGNQCFPNIRKHGCGSFTEIEVRTILSLFRATGGLMFAGDDLTQLSDNKIQLLQNFLASTGRAAVPRDLFVSRYPGLLHRTEEDGMEEITVINWKNSPVTKTLTLQECFGKPLPEVSFRVSEYWSGRELGVYRTNVEIVLPEVEAHGCRVLICHKC